MNDTIYKYPDLPLSALFNAWSAIFSTIYDDCYICDGFRTENNRWNLRCWYAKYSPKCDSNEETLYFKGARLTFPADKRGWINVCLTLVYSLRRWTNVKQTLIQRLKSAGFSPHTDAVWRWTWRRLNAVPTWNDVGMTITQRLVFSRITCITVKIESWRGARRRKCSSTRIYILCFSQSTI